MSVLSEVRERLRALVFWSREEREMDEETRFHIEMETGKNIGAGMSPDEARRMATVAFGGTERVKEEIRDARGVRPLQDAISDIRFGWRWLVRRPAFALAAAGTLALGIGAATVLASAVDHVLFRPLPYPDPERIVTVWETDRSTGETMKSVSPGNFAAWRDHNVTFTRMGLAEPAGLDLTGDGPAEAVPAWRVTEGFLEALGVRPILGRGFGPADHLPGAEPVVLVSHRLWQQRYGSSESIVGRIIQLDYAPVRVVGVLPPWVEYPEPKDLWAPRSFTERDEDDRRSSYMYALARLGPGATAAQAQADLDRIAGLLATDHPETNRNTGFSVVPLDDAIVGSLRPALLVLLAAAGLLLLIACMNVANLLLARGEDRAGELGVRAALGARRSRLARQLVTESMLLTLVGGLAGLLLAHWGIRALVGISPPELPNVDAIAIDVRVFGITLVVMLVTSLLSGVAPAVRLSRPQLDQTLRRSSRSTTAGRSASRLRGALIVSEVALALILVIGAGLLGRSFVALTDNDLGFVPEDRIALQTFLWDRNPTATDRLQRVEEITEHFLSAPGVEGVGLVSALPFHPSQIAVRGTLAIEDRAPSASDDEEERVFTSIASSGYLDVMGIPVHAGRWFDERDRGDAPPVAVINRTLARRHFAGEDPIGKRVTIGVMGPPTTREIVGVVGDVRPTALDSDPRPELFIPFRQSGTGSVTFVVRAGTDAARMVPMLRERLWEVDPEQTIYHAATMEALVADTLIERRFNFVLLALFAIVALALAGIGIYGVVSYSTSQRVQEFRLRMALGAKPRDIMALVVRQAGRLAIAGIALGLLAAIALTRFMAHMLYAIEPTDPLTFLQVGLVVLTVAVVAAIVPARRAIANHAGDVLRET